MHNLRINAVLILVFIAFIITNPISLVTERSLYAKNYDDVSSFVEQGIASWYGPGFQGRRTASGEIFDTYELTAAHKTLPFGTLLKVTNLGNEKSVIVRVNDRGPFVKGRIIDLSYAAKSELSIDGVAEVKIEVIDPESELSNTEGEIEGFTTDNLFEDVSLEKFNNLNKIYTFKKVNFKLLTPSKDDLNSVIYCKKDGEETNNSSELPVENISGYSLKIVKYSSKLSTKELIGKLESLGYKQIFIQVLTDKDSTTIYVLNGVIPEDMADYHAYKLTPVLNTMQQLKNWVEESKKYQEKLPAVLHFDTGMNRLGFDPEETPEIKSYIKQTGTGIKQ